MNIPKPYYLQPWSSLFWLSLLRRSILWSIELCIGGGLRTFCDLRSVPEAGRLREQVENYRRACTQVLFLTKAELEFFHFLEMVKGWLVPSTSQKIPLQPGRYLQPETIPLAENSFLQAGNRAENTKEKSRQCFTLRKWWNGNRMDDVCLTIFWIF